MRKLALVTGAVAALATTAVTIPSSAEARNGGRNAAIGLGIAGAALGAAAIANGGYYGPGYGYYGHPRARYYDRPYAYHDGPRYHRRYCQPEYYGW